MTRRTSHLPRLAIRAILPAAILTGLMFPVSAAAQTAFGVRWYGEIRTPAPPRTLGMGGISAVQPWGGEPSAVGHRNPALPGLAERVLYGFTWEIGSLSGDYANGSGSQMQTGPRMTGIVTPLGKGIVASVALVGMTLSEFEIHSAETSIDGVPVRYDYVGKGGLSQGIVGIAWKLPDDLGALGLSTDILFGSLKKEWKVEFPEAGYFDTSDRLDRQHIGNRWTLGAILEPHRRLRLGAAVSTKAKLDVTQIYTSTNTVADTSDAELELGGSLLAGAGFQLSDLWSVYADYRRDSWDHTSWTQAPSAITGTGADIMDLSGFSADWDLGIGVERLSRPSELRATALDAIPIRAGLRWGNLYAPDLDGGSIRLFYGTVGTAFALGRGGKAWADLAVQIGRRTGSSGVSETFWRIQLGFTGAELWFQPPQR